jgi:hypothetical protein
MLKKLLVFNPKHRLTAEEALKHRYVKDFSCPEEEIVCPGPIEISMNDNKKFSIKEYREALYADISKRKKEERKKWQAKYLSQLGVTNNVLETSSQYTDNSTASYKQSTSNTSTVSKADSSSKQMQQQQQQLQQQQNLVEAQQQKVLQKQSTLEQQNQNTSGQSSQLQSKLAAYQQQRATRQNSSEGRPKAGVNGAANGVGGGSGAGGVSQQVGGDKKDLDQARYAQDRAQQEKYAQYGSNIEKQDKKPTMTQQQEKPTSYFMEKAQNSNMNQQMGQSQYDKKFTPKQTSSKVPTGNESSGINYQKSYTSMNKETSSPAPQTLNKQSSINNPSGGSGSSGITPFHQHNKSLGYPSSTGAGQSMMGGPSNISTYNSPGMDTKNTTNYSQAQKGYPSGVYAPSHVKHTSYSGLSKKK